MHTSAFVGKQTVLPAAGCHVDEQRTRPQRRIHGQLPASIGEREDAQAASAFGVGTDRRHIGERAGQEGTRQDGYAPPPRLHLVAVERHLGGAYAAALYAPAKNQRTDQARHAARQPTRHSLCSLHRDLPVW